MPTPSQPKNQQVRRRGETLGGAGADWPMGFAPKPMLDERQPVPTDKIDLPEELQQQPQGPYKREGDVQYKPGEKSDPENPKPEE